MTSQLMGLALAAWATLIVSPLAAQMIAQPLDPLVVDDAKVCQELSQDYQELLQSISRQRDECLEGKSPFPQVDVGPCCARWSGEAAKLGACKRAQACISYQERWFCMALERDRAVKSCYERLKRYREIADLLADDEEEKSAARERQAAVNDATQDLARSAIRDPVTRKIVRNSLKKIEKVQDSTLREAEKVEKATRTSNPSPRPGGVDRGGSSGPQPFKTRTRLALREVVPGRDAGSVLGDGEEAITVGGLTVGRVRFEVIHAWTTIMAGSRRGQRIYDLTWWADSDLQGGCWARLEVALYMDGQVVGSGRLEAAPYAIHQEPGHDNMSRYDPDARFEVETTGQVGCSAAGGRTSD